jgi:hypothetical protein
VYIFLFSFNVLLRRDNNVGFSSVRVHTRLGQPRLYSEIFRIRKAVNKKSIQDNTRDRASALRLFSSKRRLASSSHAASYHTLVQSGHSAVLRFVQYGRSAQAVCYKHAVGAECANFRHRWQRRLHKALGHGEQQVRKHFRRCSLAYRSVLDRV